LIHIIISFNSGMENGDDWYTEVRTLKKCYLKMDLNT